MTEDFPAKKIYGLIGYPVEHSLSPKMHNAAFRALNINAEYGLFEIRPEQLEDFLINEIEIKDIKGESFYSQQIEGFNITIPYKVKAREILERKFSSIIDLHQMVQDSDTAQMLLNSYYVRLSGAINTVRKGERGIKYFFNTDASGFFKSLTKSDPLCLNFQPKGKNVLLIGCGGAGRAIIAGLSWKHVGTNSIYINDIDDEAISSTREYFSRLSEYSHLKGVLKFVSTKEIAQAIQDCQLLINASPVGMKEDDGSVIDDNLLRSDLYVYDVVYNRETQLIKDAKSHGALAVGGLGMLLYQGADAFELWTGQRAPVEKMREALTEAMNK